MIFPFKRTSTTGLIFKTLHPLEAEHLANNKKKAHNLLRAFDQTSLKLFN